VSLGIDAEGVEPGGAGLPVLGPVRVGDVVLAGADVPGALTE
jgi:hypothetical protein